MNMVLAVVWSLEIHSQISPCCCKELNLMPYREASVTYTWLISKKTRILFQPLDPKEQIDVANWSFTQTFSGNEKWTLRHWTQRSDVTIIEWNSRDSWVIVWLSIKGSKWEYLYNIYLQELRNVCPHSFISSSWLLSSELSYLAKWFLSLVYLSNTF